MKITDVKTILTTNPGCSLEKFGALWTSQLARVHARLGSAIQGLEMPGEHFTDLPNVIASPEKIVEVLQFLKTDDECGYDFLSDLSATDEFPDPQRFQVVYHLFSTKRHARIRVKTRVREGQKVPTAISVWPAANWAEREVYDMFGVEFAGHPDLRRILMDMRWVGYPLRKDYDLKGYQIFPTPEPINPDLLKG